MQSNSDSRKERRRKKTTTKKTEKEEDEKIHQVTDAAKGTLLQAHTHTHTKKKSEWNSIKFDFDVERVNANSFENMILPVMEVNDESDERPLVPDAKSNNPPLPFPPG